MIGIFEKGMHRCLSLYKDPKTVIWHKYQKIFHDTGDIVTTLDTPYDPKKIMCRYDEMFPLVTVSFENLSVKIQANYDAILNKIYGDYMQLPPVEKRTTHAPVILDFGEGNVIGSKKINY